jgi:4-amino-4-deoxychorismate lyase
MICWMNGEFEQSEHMRISPFDHGFLYGAGFFETFRTYEGRVFLFEEHMERLRSALNEYRIAMPYSNEEISDAIQGLHVRSGGRDGYFRLNVSAGMHDIGLAPSEYTSPNVILFRKDLAVAPRGTEKKAVWLETERNLPESRVRHKSHNFLNNVRGRLELPSLKDLEGIFLTSEGYVAEGVTSNVFWVKDGALYTPSVETGILPGLTRAYILELATQAGMDVHIGLFTKKDVELADEVFVSNSIQELVPLSAVGERLLLGASGVYYQKLHRLYGREIDKMKEG